MSSSPALDPHFTGLDGTPASYLRAARELRQSGSFDGLRQLQLAIVATCTLDPLVPYLMVEGARRGVGVRATPAPFGQLEQQLLDAGSALYRDRPDVVLIALRAEDVAPELAHGLLRLSADDIDARLGEIAARIEALAGGVRAHSDALVVVWNQVPGRWAPAGLADAGLDASQPAVVADLNRRIAGACRRVPGAFVFDAHRVAIDIGLSRWEDPKLRFLARAPLSSVACVATARALARTLRALVTPARKCLVLDLDDTLWGGILGEDGVGGIRVGQDYPGNVYLDFQRCVAAYRDRGVLLAIASRNNEADVREAFARRDDMVLRLDDFAALQIHWNDKAASLRAIARELRIGTDALVFFDDNAAEREWVRRSLPDVMVVDVPADPLGYAAALDDSGAFDSLVLTEDDRARADRYRLATQAQTFAAGSSSVEAFLRGLEMRVSVAPVSTVTAPRVAQLIAKTNQFNLTTRRHSPADVERLLRQDAMALCLRVSDRFGDHGITGVAIAVPAGAGRFELDTFLLSCRVLGRSVEDALLRAVARACTPRDGAAWLDARFIPTAKNAPAAAFLPTHGFTPVEDDEGRWRLDLATLETLPSLAYEVSDEP